MRVIYVLINREIYQNRQNLGVPNASVSSSHSKSTILRGNFSNLHFECKCEMLRSYPVPIVLALQGEEDFCITIS